MADVNNIVITGTIFDNPKFFSIKESTLTIASFTLSCNRGKQFESGFMFSVSANLKRTEIPYVSKGARVAIVGYISNKIVEGIERTIIHCREFQPMPIER